MKNEQTISTKSGMEAANIYKQRLNRKNKIPQVTKVSQFSDIMNLPAVD